MNRNQRLTVLESFPAPRSTTNPYLVQLVASFPPEVAVLTFSWRNALVAKYDLLHLHWPENLIRGSDRRRTVARYALTIALLTRLALRRTAVVRTLHNATPHEGGGRVEQFLLGRLEAMTTTWVRLNATTRPPTPAPVVTVPHGHYRDWYGTYPTAASECGRLAFVGLIRPYKGVEDLLAAFAAIPDAELRLRVVGRPTEQPLREQVEAAVRVDGRISAVLEYVDDPTLVDEVGRAQLVVLPYRELHNSGVALAALSLDRPVLLPASASADELAAEVGREWVHTFAPPLGPTELREAAARPIPPDRPDLSGREWPAAGQAHAEIFREAVRRRHGGRLTDPFVGT